MAQCGEIDFGTFKWFGKVCRSFQLARLPEKGGYRKKQSSVSRRDQEARIEGRGGNRLPHTLVYTALERQSLFIIITTNNNSSNNNNDNVALDVEVWKTKRLF